MLIDTELDTISASLVLYKNKEVMYQKAINSFLRGYPSGTLYVIDNTPQPLISDLFNLPRVVYIHSSFNVGFGAGHNLAIHRALSSYHLIINPDIEFNPDVLPGLLSKISSDKSIGAIMPKIIYPNGSPQFLCKLLPSPFDLLRRRFLPKFFQSQTWESIYELWELPQDCCSDVPTISGCFALFRTSLLHQIGGFDQRYFMYMEDVDLVRRIGDLSRVVFSPLETVVHSYEKGSYKSFKLLIYHLRSAFLYFNKWGWLRDDQRKIRNMNAIKFLKY